MKSGNINFIDTELTNEQFASLGYPALYILKNSSNTVTKFIIFDLNGVRTDYDTSSGGGDTSNLVPYTGATQDVNIASNYFKTSKGFVFTYDEDNYFKTYYSSSYNHLGFYSEDSSNDNFGYMFIEANPEIGFVVNIANGDGIYNSFHATESRTYSEKPFVSSEGFIKTGGTANQALTADGGVFDLNTKADLVDGKVPSSQLPSNKTTFTYDILVSNWTLASGKYEAVISNAGILSNSFVDVIPSNDHEDIVRNAQIYPSVLISAGSVKVYSKFLPSGTISVTVNII